MSEIKHTFQGGKMNKDLDERLVPQGEYRDALNIEVRTSDGSDAGAIQSLYGNEERLNNASFELINPTISRNNVPSSFVGSIADEKTNQAYFFVASPPNDGLTSQISEFKLYKDMIVGYSNNDNTVHPVVTDVFRLEFTTANLNAGLGSATVSYEKITVSSDYVGYIRPGMTIEAVNVDGAGLLNAFDNTFPLNGLNSSITVREVDGNDVYFDRVVIGDLSTCHAWILEADHTLNFYRKKIETKNTITGINIIEDLLFWTDNYSEPKKINIDRSLQGTNNFDDHTNLLVTNPDTNGNEFILLEYIDSNTTDSGIKEEHIAMIRKAPRTSPKLEMSKYEDGVEEDYEGVVVGVLGIFDAGGALVEEGTEIDITTDIFFATGTTLILECSGESGTDVSIRAMVEESNSTTLVHTITLQSIDAGVTADHEDWDIKVEQRKPFFELKLGRFSYRYKYQDGEYSSFAPWSELAFLPGNFDYIPKKGYNLGMVNTIRNIKITDFIVDDAQRPDDVVEVDILYKDTVSPNVYVVKSIRRGKDPEWIDNSDIGGNSGVLVISSEMIHRTLPSSQALRAWDNVPRVARAQEVTGNRVVYGNYLQNFDVKQPIAVIQSLKSINHTDILSPKKSIKSIRNYKIGVVFGDKYGRETPVLATGGFTEGKKTYNSSVSVEKSEAWRVSQLNASLDWGDWIPSSWMEYYKYYVKETTNEYYNLAMDRWYEAEDGNIWLSFQSSDRNKLDEDTYIILKNEHGSQDPVLEEARYKILAIKNEAPDFIKTTQKILATSSLPAETDYSDLEDSMIVQYDEDTWTPFEGIEFKGIGWARIGAIEGGTAKYSSWVKVARVNDVMKNIVLTSPLGPSADMASLFGVAAGDIDNWVFEVKDSVSENKPEFDGRFFVKIFRDSVLNRNVLLATNSGMTYGNVGLFDFSYVYSGGSTNNDNIAAAWKGDYTSQPGVANTVSPTAGNFSASTWNHSNGLSISDIASQHMATGCADSNPDNTQKFWKWHQTQNRDRWFLDATHTQGSASNLINSSNDNGQSAMHKGLDSNVGGVSKMHFSINVNNGASLNTAQNLFKNAMTTEGNLFRFKADPNEVVYEVVGWDNVNMKHNYSRTTILACKLCEDDESYCRRRGFVTHFKQQSGVVIDLDQWDPRSALRADGSNFTSIEMVEGHFDMPESVSISQDNAIWETEPKEDVGLDLYYEATDAIPLYLREDNNESFIPEEAVIKVHRPTSSKNPMIVAVGDLAVKRVVRDVVAIYNPGAGSTSPYPFKIAIDDVLKFTHANGMVSEAIVIDHWNKIDTYNNAADGTTATYERSKKFTLNCTVDGTFLNTTSTPGFNTTDGTIWEMSSTIDGLIPDKSFATAIGDGVIVWDSYDSLGLNNNSTIIAGTYSITFKEVTGYYRLDHQLYKRKTTLPWFNCYSFGNGLESDRIRDDYNAPTIDNGCKVSTSLDTYGEERRSSGMIYSGIYNSTSGVNNLNEFNMAESITKDLNPSYGSLQALKTRDTNVVAFCEDKVFKILANKDALYNADGNMNVTASNAVLGDVSGFSGDYGISSDPESLAVDSYRMYFTDKQRNKVLRLSQDGLTPISDAGMTSYFRENMGLTDSILGTFDEIKGEYNLSLKYSQLNQNYGHDLVLNGHFNDVGEEVVADGGFSSPEEDEIVTDVDFSDVSGEIADQDLGVSWEGYVSDDSSGSDVVYDGEAVMSESVLNSTFDEVGSELSEDINGTNWETSADAATLNNLAPFATLGEIKWTGVQTGYVGVNLANDDEFTLDIGSHYAVEFDYTLASTTSGSSGVLQFKAGAEGSAVHTLSNSNVASLGRSGRATATVIATSTNWHLTANSLAVATVSNVTVKKIDPNNRWVTKAGWLLENGKATYSGEGDNDIKQLNVIEIGKTYEVTVDVLANSGSGINTVFVGGTQVSTKHLEIGTHVFEGSTSNSNTNIYIYGRGGEDFQIGSVSVKEIDPHWKITVDKDDTINNVGIHQSDLFEYEKSYKVVVRARRNAVDGGVDFRANVARTKGQYINNFPVDTNLPDISQVGLGSMLLTTSYQDFTFYHTCTIGGDTLGYNDLFIQRLESQTYVEGSQIIISSVSVVEVAPSWTISTSDHEAVSVRVGSDGATIISETGEYVALACEFGGDTVMEVGKNYTISVDAIVNSGSGVKLNHFHSIHQGITTTGLHTFNSIGKGNSHIAIARRDASGSSSTTIRSISIKEVHPKWEVSSYIGSFISSDSQASHTPTYVINEDYEYTTNVDLIDSDLIWNNISPSNGWTENNEGVFIGDETDTWFWGGGLIEAHKSYEVKYTISEYVAGQVRIRGTAGGDDTPLRSENGDYTEILVLGETTNSKLYIIGFQDENADSFTGNISNIQLREINHLPNATISDVDDVEALVDTSFDDETKWNKNPNWTVSGSNAVCDGTSTASINQSLSNLVIGGAYEVVVEVTELTRGRGFKVRLGDSGLYSVIPSKVGFHKVRLLGSSFSGIHNSIYINPLPDIGTASTNITIGKIGSVSAKLLYTAKITKSNDKDWRSAFIKQPVIYTPGKTYMVRFRAKAGSNMAESVIQARHNFNFSSAYAVGDGFLNGNINISTDWQYFEGTFIADNDSSDISFGAPSWHLSGIGEYFFIDSVKVKEVGSNWNFVRSDNGQFGGSWEPISFGFVGGGRARITNIAHETGTGITQVQASISQDNVFEPGKKYSIQLTASEVIPGSGSKVKLLGAENVTGNYGFGFGTHTGTFIASQHHVTIMRLDPSINCDMYIDDVVIRELEYTPTAPEDKTISFNEKSKGWSSFKSFVPETGLSINDEYLTGRDARVWSHHAAPLVAGGTPYANNFYGAQYTSTVDILFNDNPSSVKGFGSINYEGTQAKVNAVKDEYIGDAAGNTLSTLDGEYYNLNSQEGWYVESFNTDLQEARVGEFIDKEGKWFNHIGGITTTLSNLDSREFTVQGIGIGTLVPEEVPDEVVEPVIVSLTIQENND